MSNALQIFNYEGSDVRTVDINGEPWFVGKDVALVLGYKDSSDALKRHVDNEDKLTRSFADSGQRREMYVINESGLYALVLSSKIPTAKRFKRWVTSEVLPTIRKHGMYITEEVLASPETLLKIVENYKKEYDLRKQLEAENAQQQKAIEEMTPKVNYCDTVLRNRRAIAVTIIAKDYGMSARAFNQMLADMNIQYRVNGTWVLYQPLAGKGYAKTMTYTTNAGYAHQNLCWTQKGRMFLYEELKKKGIVPLIERDETDVAPVMDNVVYIQPEEVVEQWMA